MNVHLHVNVPLNAMNGAETREQQGRVKGKGKDEDKGKFMFTFKEKGVRDETGRARPPSPE